MISIFDRIENIVRRGENVGSLYFFTLPRVSLTLSQTTNLDSSKMKDFADDNFNSDENGSKFSKRVEYTVGKGEIARYEQFFLFPQCFQKTYTADA